MPHVHTHYDNLKVTRNAPPEVIRAAYKTLCQKFHPDRNPNDESAKKTFLLIRAAYETLSDPEKRKLHDAWISSVEAAEIPDVVVARQTIKSKKSMQSSNQAGRIHRQKRVWQICFWLITGLLVLIGFFFD